MIYKMELKVVNDINKSNFRLDNLKVMLKWNDSNQV